MAILECDKDGACKCISINVIRCAKAMKIVQKQGSSSAPVTRPREMRLLRSDAMRQGDVVRVGLRTFDPMKLDIVLKRIDKGKVDVTVLDDERVIFTTSTSRDAVRYVPSDSSGSLSVSEALDAETEFIRADPQELTEREIT